MTGEHGGGSLCSTYHTVTGLVLLQAVEKPRVTTFLAPGPPQAAGPFLSHRNAISGRNLQCRFRIHNLGAVAHIYGTRIPDVVMKSLKSDVVWIDRIKHLSELQNDPPSMPSL